MWKYYIDCWFQYVTETKIQKSKGLLWFKPTWALDFQAYLKTPWTIDLIITNYKTSFMKSETCETGLSDHHKMVRSFLRKTFAKENLKQFTIGVL